MFSKEQVKKLAKMAYEQSVRQVAEVEDHSWEKQEPLVHEHWIAVIRPVAEAIVAEEREAILTVLTTLHKDHCATADEARGVEMCLGAVRARGK